MKKGLKGSSKNRENMIFYTLMVIFVMIVFFIHSKPETPVEEKHIPKSKLRTAPVVESCLPNRIKEFNWKRNPNSIEIQIHTTDGNDIVSKDPYRDGNRVLKDGTTLFWNVSLNKDPHPDTIATACILAFMPHLSDCLVFPKPVSVYFVAQLEALNIKKQAGHNKEIRILSMVDSNLTPANKKLDYSFGMKGNTKSVVVWGGGSDSSGVAILLHDSILYHEEYLGKNDYLEPLDDKHGRALKGWRQRGRVVKIVKTNLRKMYGKGHWGMPWWGSVMVGSLLYAEANKLKSISTGTISDALFLASGFRGKNAPSITHLVKHGAPFVAKMCELAGIWYNQPNGPIGEWAGAKIIMVESKKTNTNVINDISYCDKHHGEHCNKCSKCARKEALLLAAAWEVSGIPPAEAIKLFPNNPEKPYMERYHHHYHWQEGQIPPPHHPKCGYYVSSRASFAKSLMKHHDFVDLKELPSKKILMDIDNILPKMDFTDSVSETLLQSTNRPAPFAAYLKRRYREYDIPVADAGSSQDINILKQMNSFSYQKLAEEALKSGMDPAVFKKEIGESHRKVETCHSPQVVKLS